MIVLELLQICVADVSAYGCDTTIFHEAPNWYGSIRAACKTVVLVQGSD